MVAIIPGRRGRCRGSEAGGGGALPVVAGQHDRLLGGIQPGRAGLPVGRGDRHLDAQLLIQARGAARRTTARAIGPRSACIPAEVTVPTTFPSAPPRRTSPPAAIGRSCEPSTCSITSRRGGWPRLRTLATVS